MVSNILNIKNYTIDFQTDSDPVHPNLQIPGIACPSLPSIQNDRLILQKIPTPAIHSKAESKGPA